MLADAWLPDLVRLGEMERHLGDGVIEAVVDAAMEQGRLRPRQRRRIMSYPLVIRLMIAMTKAPDAGMLRTGTKPYLWLLTTRPRVHGLLRPMALQPFAGGLLTEAATPEDVKSGGPNGPRAVFAVQVFLHPRHHVVLFVERSGRLPSARIAAGACSSGVR